MPACGLNIRSDLSVHPIVQEVAKGHSVTMGDIHGSALLMFNFLVANGIFKLKNEGDYQTFVNAFDNMVGLIKEHVFTKICMLNTKMPFLVDLYSQFFLNTLFDSKTNEPELKKVFDDIKNVIDSASVINHPCTVRFMGDLLADRGPCDYFILQILNKLVSTPVKVVILFSNHDHVFCSYFPFSKKRAIEICKQGFNYEHHAHAKSPHPALGPFQSLSLQTFLAGIANNFFTAEAVNRLVENAYKPYLQLVDYSFEPSNNDKKIAELRLYMHAPNPSENLLELIQQFTKRTTKEILVSNDTLIASLNEVNIQFKKRFPEDNNNPTLREFVWRRLLQSQTYQLLVYTINTPEKLNVRTIHGHDGTTNVSTILDDDGISTPINLNGELGRLLFDNILSEIPEKHPKDALKTVDERTKGKLYLYSCEAINTVYNRNNGQMLAHAMGSNGSTGNVNNNSLLLSVAVAATAAAAAARSTAAVVPTTNDDDDDFDCYVDDDSYVTTHCVFNSLPTRTNTRTKANDDEGHEADQQAQNVKCSRR